MQKKYREKFAAVALVGAVALTSADSGAQAEKPQYGGTLSIAHVYYTLNAQSFDPADWSWKLNQDAGLTYETLLAADLSKAVSRGGRYRFLADAWLPSDAIRGELAESWQFKDNPPRAEIRLRKGVMFPEKPGVMAARELTADDVVTSHYRIANSPKRPPLFLDHVQKVEALDRYTVLYTFNFFHAEWDFRLGYSWYVAIVPKEVSEAGAANWKNVNGTGPFALTDYVAANALTFSRNPAYWDSETIGGVSYKLPFADKIVYRIIKDEAAAMTALRTGKLDLVEAIRWNAVEELKKSAPQLQWGRGLSTLGTALALRVDTKPFDDLRVRRALNMAIDKKEIVASFYGGNAELLGFPQHPDFIGYYEPLESMPAAVKELFTFDPKKAKQLLTEAGLPNGFTFKVQVCTCNPDHMDLLPLIAAYWEKLGVKIEIQPMEFGPFWSAMTTGTNAPGYVLGSAVSSPLISLGKNFVTEAAFNPSRYSDAQFDQRIKALRQERDEGKRQAQVKELTRDILAKAPYVWLPMPYYYGARWPWVKNYAGELRAGAERPGPIHARIWIDQELKKKMGF